MDQALNNVCPITGGRVDMVTAQDPTAMDMTAMVSMNDMHLHSVSRLMLGLSFSLNLMTLSKVIRTLIMVLCHSIPLVSSY